MSANVCYSKTFSTQDIIKWVTQGTMGDSERHSKAMHKALRFINLFTSLTKLKLSCSHEYMNEVARENARRRADKTGQYQ